MLRLWLVCMLACLVCGTVVQPARPKPCIVGNACIIQKARHIMQRTGGDFIFVMYGNKAMVPMIHNWLCNTRGFANVHNRTLIIVTDKPGYASLRANPYGVHVVRSHSLGQGYDENMDFSSVGYWLLTASRVKTLAALLLSDVSFFNIEADAVWLRNPLSDWGLMSSKADIVVAEDNSQLAFGWMKVAANQRTKLLFRDLWQQLHDNLSKLSGKSSTEVTYSQSFSEQITMKRLLKERHTDVTVDLVDSCDYAMGVWYEENAKAVLSGAALRSRCTPTHGMPVVINNNWIVGNDAKIRRAKAWGHWFIDDQGTCWPDLVSRAMGVPVDGA